VYGHINALLWKIVDCSFLTIGRIFQVDKKKHGNGALGTDVDAAYSKKGELGNNENKNKIKKYCIREVHIRAIKQSEIQCKNGASVLVALSIIPFHSCESDRLCVPVVRIAGYRSKGPGSIPSATRER
jgi:hypothetical protein